MKEKKKKSHFHPTINLSDGPAILDTSFDRGRRGWRKPWPESLAARPGQKVLMEHSVCRARGMAPINSTGPHRRTGSLTGFPTVIVISHCGPGGMLEYTRGARGGGGRGRGGCRWVSIRHPTHCLYVWGGRKREIFPRQLLEPCLASLHKSEVVSVYTWRYHVALLAPRVPPDLMRLVSMKNCALGCKFLKQVGNSKRNCARCENKYTASVCEVEKWALWASGWMKWLELGTCGFFNIEKCYFLRDILGEFDWG